MNRETGKPGNRGTEESGNWGTGENPVTQRIRELCSNRGGTYAYVHTAARNVGAGPKPGTRNKTAHYEKRKAGSIQRRSTALVGGRKEWISIVLYLFSIPMAFVHIAISIGCYMIVAAVWIVPAKGLEKAVEE